MSTLIGLRLNDTAVLATDSRIIENSGTDVLTDTAQKIFEIAPGTFYGWSGYGSLATPQAQIAAEIARTADMGNLRGFADQLDAASQPLMLRILDTLAGIQHLRPNYAAELAGKKPFHAYVLAGVSDGCPGFLAREFWLVNGRIAIREADGFHLPAGNNFAMYVTYGELLSDLVQNPKTWADGAVPAAERFVDHLRDVQPLVGGPTQMACVDKGGSKWVHRPAVTPFVSEQIGPATLPVGVLYAGAVNCSQLQAGTINAAVSLTSAAIDVTTSGGNIKLDGFNWLLITDSVTTSSQVQAKPGSVFVTTTQAGAAGLLLDSSGNGVLRAKDNSGNVTDMFGGTSGTANGGGATLSANPIGFILVKINGTAREIPYYAS